MKIARISRRHEHLPLTRPYTIAFRSIDAVDNAIVRVETETGHAGLGAASPEAFVTGEAFAATLAALDAEATRWLAGADVRALPALCRAIAAKLRATPAAAAAPDMALHDLFAQLLGLPLCETLGRVHTAFPTSITIGIKPLEAALAEAREYVERGFTILKVKGGHSLDEDVARLRALRQAFGGAVAIRVDLNQGYTLEQTGAFFARTAGLDIELVEQPVKAAAAGELRALPEDARRRIALDESILTEKDALALAAPPAPAGIFNIKLMKCGGIAPALRIAAIAEHAGISLMWGCMDESRISIAAALHAALASPATAYLDLDGSFDLARDVAAGGFTVEGGVMRALAAPGLGVAAI